MSNEITLPAVSGSAYDAESDSMVVVTTEMRERLWQIQRFRGVALLTECVLLAEVADNKLYLAAGFQSMKEFIEATSDYSYRTAQRRLAIGRDAAPLLGPGSLNGLMALSDSDQSSDGEDDYSSLPVDDDGISAISKLGMGKLYAVASMDGYSIPDLMEGKEFRADDGTVLTSEDIYLMEARALNDYKREHGKSEKRYREALSRREEEIKKLKAEHQRDEQLDAEIKRLRKENDDLHNAVGEQWADLEGTLRALQKAEANLLDTIGIVVARKVDVDSPTQLKESVVAVHTVAKRCLENIEFHYGNALALATYDRQTSGVKSRFDFEGPAEDEVVEE